MWEEAVDGAVGLGCSVGNLGVMVDVGDRILTPLVTTGSVGFLRKIGGLGNTVCPAMVPACIIFGLGKNKVVLPPVFNDATALATDTVLPPRLTAVPPCVKFFTLLPPIREVPCSEPLVGDFSVTIVTTCLALLGLGEE